MLTDDTGIFDITELPAGPLHASRVSKSGFVALSYGQRRPLQAGTPLQLADGQQIKGVDFQPAARQRHRRPRARRRRRRDARRDASACMRYQYLQGDRRLTPAGTAQTDDKGQYRVWG